MKDYRYLFFPLVAVIVGSFLFWGSGPNQAGAQFTTSVHREADRLTVAEGGVFSLHGEQLRTARVQINNATSVGSATVSGVLPGDLGIASLNLAGATSGLNVICSTNTVTVNLANVASTTTTIPVLLFLER